MTDLLWFLVPLIPFTLLVMADSSPDDGVDPVDAHKARLKALDNDEARGLLSTREAAEARTEIKRRLLKAARTADGLAFVRGNALASPMVWISLVVLLGLGGAYYQLTGAPDLKPSPGISVSRLDDLLEEGNPTTYGEAIRVIQSHLADNPADEEGWRLLAQTAMAVGDPSLAAGAYSELAEITDDTITARLSQVQAMMLMTDRRITPAVGLVLEKVRAENPSHPALDYYRGITALQNGNEAAAEEIWTALLDRSPDTAWYVPQLRRELARMQMPVGRGVGVGTGNGALAPQLDRETMAAAADMSADEQRAMVESMLQRLETRLENEPTDSAGWLRLAEARLRLDQPREAKAVIDRAKIALPLENHGIFDDLLDNILAHPEFMGGDK